VIPLGAVGVVSAEIDFRRALRDLEGFMISLLVSSGGNDSGVSFDHTAKRISRS
jgi:hypothetical protein